MTATAAQVRLGLDARTGDTEYLSAHTEWSATGLSEVFGGTYIRERIIWGAAATTVGTATVPSVTTVANTNEVALSIPASTKVRWLGRWTAETGGTFLGMVPNGSSLVGLGCMPGQHFTQTDPFRRGFGSEHFFFVALDPNWSGEVIRPLRLSTSIWLTVDPYLHPGASIRGQRFESRLLGVLPPNPPRIPPQISLATFSYTEAGNLPRQEQVWNATTTAIEESYWRLVIVTRGEDADFVEAARLTLAVGEFKLTGLF